jgi:4-diphosphocytidyl-2-C-methyl-D-erythritol kinase
MIFFPPCKINLGLKVVNKRVDGFHNLETVMFILPICDVLEVVKAPEFTFLTSGKEIPGNPNSNLCVKAFELLKREKNIGNVYIHLYKNIPMGGGLGGGSSNGTYTLLALNSLFELNLSNDELRHYAAELGSDCPLFVENVPQYATGRGEILEPFSVDLKGYYLKIINIGIHCSTKDAFSSLILKENDTNLRAILERPIETWKGALHNDFEDSIFPLYPELKELKDSLYAEGAVYASMTGSGSTLYGIYKVKPTSTFTKSEHGFEEIIQL